MINASEQYLATDVRGLYDLKRQAGKDGGQQALGEAARHFESQFFKMVMKSMRQTNKVFSEGNLFSQGSGGEMFRDMMDEQLIDRMTRSGSVGLADMLVEQLQTARRTGKNAAQSFNLSAKRNDLPMFSKQKPVAQSETENQVKKSAPVIQGPKDFVEKLMPLAKKAAEKLGVDPRVLLAQAALETGWGQKVIRSAKGQSSHNFFNIKADHRWSGDKVQVATLEFSEGIARKQQAHFRAYPDQQSSFDDYVEFIQSSDRYAIARSKASNSAEYVNALQDAGYATDPQYANKILNVLKSEHFPQQLSGSKG